MAARLEMLNIAYADAQDLYDAVMEDLNHGHSFQSAQMLKTHATMLAERKEGFARLFADFKEEADEFGEADTDSCRILDEIAEDMNLSLAQMKDVQALQIAQLKDMQALERAQMDETHGRKIGRLIALRPEYTAAAVAEAAATEAAEDKLPTKEIDGKVYLWDPETNGLWENFDGLFGMMVGTYQPDNAEQPILFEAPPSQAAVIAVKPATLNKRKSEEALKRLGMAEFRKGLTGTKGEKRAATIKERHRREAILAAGQAPDWPISFKIRGTIQIA